MNGDNNGQNNEAVHAARRAVSQMNLEEVPDAAVLQAANVHLRERLQQLEQHLGQQQVAWRAIQQQQAQQLQMQQELQRQIARQQEQHAQFLEGLQPVLQQPVLQQSPLQQPRPQQPWPQKPRPQQPPLPHQSLQRSDGRTIRRRGSNGGRQRREYLQRRQQRLLDVKKNFCVKK